MLLKEILNKSDQFNQAVINKVPAIEITGIVYDSRAVTKGSLFVALPGGNFDGHNFIRNAIDQGAAAVIGELDLFFEDVPYFKVKNSRSVLAFVAAAFYDFPGRKLTVIGVTGTDGKTTTVNLIHSILTYCRFRAGMISTVNALIGDEEIDTGFHVTTPESPKIQEMLKKMVDHGLTHVVIEATSHGLEQFRVTACDFDIGVITNITHEHLDYHGDYEHYLKAKSALLTGLIDTKDKKQGNYRLAVLNRDDQSYKPIKDILRDERYRDVKILEYGIKEQSDVVGNHIKNKINGLELEIRFNEKKYQIQSALIGEYNAYNILAAILSTVKGLGLDMECVKRGVASLQGVPGRMERIDCGQDFTAIIDFAHTPNALKVALETSRNRTKKRVIAVFGSAGLRDREKRRLMAATSIKSADISILTAEDPRTESLDVILDEMADEALKLGGIENDTFFRIPDRGRAIIKAIEIAKKGDLVIICGKGHEQSMCFGDTEFPWDDRTALKAALSSLMGIEGPEMPYLPTRDQ